MELKMTKATAVLKLLRKGYSAKEIQEQLGVSLSYVHLLKKKLAEGVGEVVETVKDTLGMPCTRECMSEPEVGEVDAILNERATTYGSFISVALFAQEMKELIRSALDEQNAGLQADHQEALDMIASKIARIITGNSQHRDSWLDIAGYATLVADRIQGKIR
jgi:transcriptional regulator